MKKAAATPHFAIIEGPPGSGKTTVIAAIIRRALERGDRVLVVSPTHTAVDNVVEKLVARASGDGDDLSPVTLPVRFAVRPTKLSSRALQYWVGATHQRRGATVGRRLQKRLTETIGFADALFKLIDEDAAGHGHAPITAALTRVESVICGTPIGILSYDTVKNAEPGSFGLVIVDEVSKMTLPEFLAIAVKAQRWVLIGDPAQLAPYNDGEENGATLSDVLSPMLELVCSVGAILKRAKPSARRDERMVVVSSDPGCAVAAIRAHLATAFPDGAPSVGLIEDDDGPGIVVCSTEELSNASESLRRSSANGIHTGSLRPVRILAERGIHVADAADGSPRLFGARQRAPAAIFETCAGAYHAQPWSRRSGMRLRFLGFRNGLRKYLPTDDALAIIGNSSAPGVRASRGEIIATVAARFAINAVSVFDWVTGIPSEFDVSPLRELAALSSPTLRDSVRPFVGTLKKQYRMHPVRAR